MELIALQDLDSQAYKNEYDKMSKASNPYGDGNTSKYIADAIIERYGK